MGGQDSGLHLHRGAAGGRRGGEGGLLGRRARRSAQPRAHPGRGGRRRSTGRCGPSSPHADLLSLVLSPRARRGRPRPHRALPGAARVGEGAGPGAAAGDQRRRHGRAALRQPRVEPTRSCPGSAAANWCSPSAPTAAPATTPPNSPSPPAGTPNARTAGCSTGCRRRVPWAQYADRIAVPAHTDDGRAVLALVPRDHDGLALAEQVSTSGERFAEVSLDSVRIGSQRPDRRRGRLGVAAPAPGHRDLRAGARARRGRARA